MGKKSGVTIYYEYYISYDLGICHGPVDELVQVYFNEKAALDDDETIIGAGSLEINKPDLFGGFEREGGIVGTIDWRHGTSTQLISHEGAKRMGVDENNAPGYRDIAHIFYHGDHNSDRDGGSVGTNNPKVPTTWVRIRRASKTLGVNTNVIVNANNGTDTNPAAYLHELLVNDAWGMGGDPGDINLASFVYAAQVLYDEKFGISFMWTKQSTIEDHAQEVLDHIKGMMFFNPYDGQVHLKLVRNDYDPNTLPQQGPDTCTLVSFNRKLWSETVNEIVVTYTDPADGAETSATITYQDPGNIANQGEIVSASRDYYMIRTADLASMVCQRELQSESAPLASVEINALRTAWKHADGSPILPGDCIRFRWEPYGITNIVLRVMEIDWGTVDSSTVKVQLIEDIFAFQLSEYALPGGPQVQDPGQDPNSDAMAVFPAKFFAAPFSLLQQDLGSDADTYLLDSAYPREITGVCAYPKEAVYDQNGKLLDGTPDLQSFYLWVPYVNTLGNPDWISNGEKQLTGVAQLGNALVQEVHSTVLIANKIGGDGPEVGRYAILGDDNSSEYADEWIMFEANLGNGLWQVRRGVMDTIPNNWPVNTKVYCISTSWDGYDTSEALAFVSKEYILQPRTSKGIRELVSSMHFTTARPDRPYLPYRPANVKVAGVMFGGVDDSQIPEGTHEPRQRWIFNITWSRRNRKLEENVVLAWDAADVMPEDGQTTEIIILADGTEVDRITGLTGTSYDFDITEHTYVLTNMSLKFVSRRDGYESLQGITIDLALYIKGYGSDWDYMYGGWPPLPTP